MARWPNAKFSDGTIWDNDNDSKKGTITMMKMHIQMGP